jgi:hypothetical protein
MCSFCYVVSCKENATSSLELRTENRCYFAYKNMGHFITHGRKKDFRHLAAQFAGPVFHTVQRGEMNHYFREGNGLLRQELVQVSSHQGTIFSLISYSGLYSASIFISAGAW